MRTIEFGVEYPATTQRPRPSGDGVDVHEYLDVSMYIGTPAGDRYLAAGDDGARRRAALADMPEATVKFYELPKGESFFASPDEDYPDDDGDVDPADGGGGSPAQCVVA